MSSAHLTYAHTSWAISDLFAGVFTKPSRPPARFERSVDIPTTSLAFDLVIESLRRQLEQCGQVASAELLPCLLPDSSTVSEMPMDDGAMAQRRKNQAAMRLLEEWLADESGYDEVVWPRVKKAIQENRPSYRSRFDE